MSINDISTCLKGGKSCGGGREEDASNLLWCQHCGIALCFDCDTYLHNLKSSKHGHLRVLLPASRTASVRKCEHGLDGGSNVRIDLIQKPSLSKKKNKKRASKSKVRGSSATSNPETGRRSASSQTDISDGGFAITLCDVGDLTVQESETSDSSSDALSSYCEKTASSSLKLRRSALRGGHEEAGLGPRPKLYVTWHPDVTDPICSIVSHTVGHRHGPAFLSRRSQQKHMRQKNKSSSKSQARAKKQEKKLKKSEVVHTGSELPCDSMMNRETEPESSKVSSPCTNEKSTDCTRSCCAYCIDGQSLCDCVHMPCKSNDRNLKPTLPKDVINSENHTDKIVQDPSTMEVEEQKSMLATEDGSRNETLPEDYRRLLASMLHAATSLGQNQSSNANTKYEAVAGLFRDMEMHASGANLSRPEVVFKQLTRDKISAWISVV
ncbi:uncharacterized protein [Physcomitrium patens]|uniref:Uncharacterized protein n=1 Tax=Physcomitrium patens TaxID=3218 RepID=A9RPT0_PHYPA|nr:uncharacterized protein LOC112288201 [Physcomitrium patens]XP_024387946.1 uncharacterized protein LOC112288201 [Physcomitrium patens]PNR62771.1 hypothetical protein PHYPA_001195 [Physcomitrium patens]|eukprot:XP_024387937.1 uncharacterized protein LOC112288201 [Physcomitrella patens]